jgi:5S rRNA maturation endonuclease (ribonuclease M5)
MFNDDQPERASHSIDIRVYILVETDEQAQKIADKIQKQLSEMPEILRTEHLW